LSGALLVSTRIAGLTQLPGRLQGGDAQHFRFANARLGGEFRSAGQRLVDLMRALARVAIVIQWTIFRLLLYK
jgi:hypothetical protein